MVSSSEGTMNLARQIFMKGVTSVVPSNLIRSQVELNGPLLNIQRCSIDLDKYARSYIVGFGKAVLPMAEEMMSVLDNKVERCLLSVPDGTRAQNNLKIEMCRGAKNNIPDAAAFQTAVMIVDLVKSCTDKDLIIVLISGGGSALFPYPKPPITLEEKISLIKRLSQAGASINELNAIRSKLSVVKGGGLVRLCPAKRMVSLILSDVLGDPLDIIASGPTYSATTQISSEQAKKIVKKYLKNFEVPSSITTILQKDNTDEVNPLTEVDNVIIGNNKIALQAAADEAKAADLIPILITSSLEGEARDVGLKISILSHFVSRIFNNDEYSESERVINTTLDFFHSSIGNELLSTVKIAKEQGKGICLLFGGETTVTVLGKGVGGRNQELALSAAMALNSISASENENITILSAGTDGYDGPNSAAGAVVDKSTCPIALGQGFNPETFLNKNDSYNFFSQVSNGDYHIVTGHTGTNVMDIVVVIIRPPIVL